MTGQFPTRNSLHQHFSTIEHHKRAGMPDWLNPEAPMLPRMLQAAGYATARFGKWKFLLNEQLAKAELYNIEADWAEAHDVAAKHPELVDLLSDKIQR